MRLQADAGEILLTEGAGEGSALVLEKLQANKPRARERRFREVHSTRDYSEGHRCLTLMRSSVISTLPGTASSTERTSWSRSIRSLVHRPSPTSRCLWGCFAQFHEQWDTFSVRGATPSNRESCHKVWGRLHADLFQQLAKCLSAATVSRSCPHPPKSEEKLTIPHYESSSVRRRPNRGRWYMVEQRLRACRGSGHRRACEDA